MIVEKLLYDDFFLIFFTCGFGIAGLFSFIEKSTTSMKLLFLDYFC